MSQVVKKRLAFGHDSSSSNDALQRTISKKMIQTSILRYITSDRHHLTALNSSSFLLRLPYEIRKRIYEYAGLYGGKVISLNYQCPEWLADSVRTDHSLHALVAPEDWQDEEEESEYSKRISRLLDGPMRNPNIKLQRAELYCCEEFEEDGICDCDFEPPSIPSQLLDVCHAISREVERLFLSQNHFSVYSKDTGGLAGLSSLRPRALAMLSSLTIHLDIYNYVAVGKTSKSIYPVHKRTRHIHNPRHKSLFTNPTFLIEPKMMVEWKKLCQNLTFSITPHQLKLAVICEVADFETAKQIVEPMLCLPILGSCTISFSTIHCTKIDTGKLRGLARDTALKLTGRSFAALESSFRFLDLPREIQINVLKYTDLVTPYDIAWCPDMSHRMHRECSGALHARSIMWDDWVQNSYWRKCCAKCSPLGTLCCCSTKNTTYSTTCICWVMPTSFFSICRLVREDAIKIFYSQNHFIVLPSLVPNSQPPLSYDQPSEILRFFTRFAARGTKYLRSVTWRVPETIFPIAGTRAHWELERAIDIWTQGQNPESLSFTIDLTAHAHRRRYLQNAYRNLIPIAQMEDDEWKAALLVVESMGCYNIWKNVYVHLSWPWHNPYNPNDPYSCIEEAQDLREQQEAVLEQQVMGPNYAAECKYDRRHAWNGYVCNYEDCEEC